VQTAQQIRLSDEEVAAFLVRRLCKSTATLLISAQQRKETAGYFHNPKRQQSQERCGSTFSRSSLKGVSNLKSANSFKSGSSLKGVM